MTYLSVCSGIEAATVAWRPLGWHALAVAEIDRFPSAVLAHHYPEVPNYGDVTRFADWPDATPDLLVGGTPCQSFSVAGLRAGLGDPRGNLALTYLAIARRYRPRWLVWENVPGVLSSDDGRAFRSFLGGLAELGYGFAYRVLDAQYFGLAQRRRRVYVVGHLGDWRRAAAVLFERASLLGDPPPRRETGQSVAPTVSGGAPFGRTGNERVECEAVIPDLAGTVGGSSQSGGFRTTDLDNSGAFIPIAGTLTGGTSTSANHRKRNGSDADTLIASTLEAGPHGGNPLDKTLVAFDARQSDVIQYGDVTDPLDTDGHTIAQPLLAKSNSSHDDSKETYIPSGGMQVRRLTPRECERLQGFPDDYTLIPYRGKPAADGPRYKALGNAMAVPVMRWIGERIALVESIPVSEDEEA